MKKIKKKLEKYLPNIVKLFLFKLYYIYKSQTYKGNNYVCSICDTHINEFKTLDSIANGLFVGEIEAFGNNYTVDNYETLNRNNFLCPVCGSLDKARLYKLYFDIFFLNNKFNKKIKYSLIHFAPEGGLSNLLRWHKFINYRSADLLRDNVDDNVDLTNMNIYKNAQFDIFIC